MIVVVGGVAVDVEQAGLGMTLIGVDGSRWHLVAATDAELAERRKDAHATVIAALAG